MGLLGVIHFFREFLDIRYRTVIFKSILSRKLSDNFRNLKLEQRERNKSLEMGVAESQCGIISNA